MHPQLPSLRGVTRRYKTIEFGSGGWGATDDDVDLPIRRGEMLSYVGVVSFGNMFELDVSYRPGDPNNRDQQLMILENIRIPKFRAVDADIFPLGNYVLPGGHVRFSYARGTSGDSVRFEISVIKGAAV